MQLDIILEYTGSTVVVRGVFQTNQRYLVIPLPGNVQQIVRVNLDDVADVTAFVNLIKQPSGSVIPESTKDGRLVSAAWKGKG